MKTLIAIATLGLLFAIPAQAGHRHDDPYVDVRWSGIYADVHYRNYQPRHYDGHHRHYRGCGHRWDGRYWGKPVPYHYRPYKRYDWHHYRKWHGQHHHRRDHHRRDHRREDRHDRHRGHPRRDDRHRDGHHRDERGRGRSRHDD